EILLGENRVEALPLDHAEAAIVHQLVDDHFRDALADVLAVVPPVIDGAEVEIEQRHRRTRRLRMRSRNAEQQGRKGDAHQTQVLPHDSLLNQWPAVCAAEMRKGTDTGR